MRTSKPHEKHPWGKDTHCRGMAARTGSVHTQLTGSWVGPEHTHNSTILLLNWQLLRLRPPFHLGPPPHWLTEPALVWQNSKVTLSRSVPTLTHMTSTGPASKALLQKAGSNLRYQSQHQLTNTQALHTGNQARPHGVNFFFFKVPLVIKIFDLALMWAITGLLFRTTSCC